MSIDITLTIHRRKPGAQQHEATASHEKATGTGKGSSAAVAAGRAVQELLECAGADWSLLEDNVTAPPPQRFYIKAGKRMGEICSLMEKKGTNPAGEDVWLVEYETDKKQGRESMRFLEVAPANKSI